MQRSTLAKRVWLLLLLAVFAIYLYGLGRLPLLGPDEPRYAQVAREMWGRGDWVTPTLGGRTWFEKPALLYWMMAASFNLFGVSEWAARLGPAGSGALSVLFIGWLGTRVERAAETNLRWLGLASSIALASSIGLIVFSRGASFDAPLTMTITGALACFLVSELETNKRKKSRLLIGFYAGMGMSLLAKGLIGVVIPAGVVVAYFALRREWLGRSLRRSLLWGAVTTASVAAVWYGPVIWKHGWLFIDEFFVQHHFARYASNKYHHPQPFYFYLPVTALLALPWTPFLIAALNTTVRATNFRSQNRGNDAGNRLRLFALAWLLWPVIFFSLSGSKLPGYVLPALPGAALLVGERLAAVLRGESVARHSLRATGVLLQLLGGGAIVYAIQTQRISVSNILVVALPVVMTGLFAFLWWRKARLSVLLIAAVTLTSSVLIVDCGVERAVERLSLRGLLREAAAQGYRTEPIYGLYTFDRTAEFYAASQVAYGHNAEPVIFDSVSQVIELLDHTDAVLVITFTDAVHHLTGSAALETKIIGDNGKVALIYVRRL